MVVALFDTFPIYETSFYEFKNAKVFNGELKRKCEKMVKRIWMMIYLLIEQSHVLNGVRSARFVVLIDFVTKTFLKKSTVLN